MENIPAIAGKLPPLIPISMIGIERIDIEKKRFLYKNIFEVRFILMAFRSWTYFCYLERGYRGYYQYQ